MRAVVTRVAWARVVVDGVEVGACGPGLLALVAAHRDDDEATARKCADRVAGLRIFADGEGKMNRSLADVATDGEPSAAAQILAVSNFTVYGDPSKSRRPSFTEAAGFEDGKRLFEVFVEALRERGCRVATGEFGAHMEVDSRNDGPVTLIVDVPPAR